MRTPRLTALLAYALAAAIGVLPVTACSSSTAGSDGGIDSSVLASCPAAQPAEGDPCSPSGAACEYGGDANGNCRTITNCTSGSSPHWIVASEGSCTVPPQCPSTYADVQQGMACPLAPGDACSYPEGRCGCETCSTDAGGMQVVWHCNAADSLGADCPAPRPKLGEACPKEGVSCTYNECCTPPSLGPNMTCLGGTWQPYVNVGCSCAMPACP